MRYDLELVDVTKTYANGNTAVSHINLRIARGEFVSFLGPSGCGKTTTLRMIAGFESISSGDLLIRERNVSDLPAERRPTATIFQNFALFPHMTVRQNIAFGLEVKRQPKAQIEKSVDRIISLLKLDDIADRNTNGLSGGQRQRVALARGLVIQPEILLLDEPLGALDASTRKQVQQELKTLQRELGITFLLVTHSQSEALMLSDRVVVMNKGQIEQVATPQELYAKPATEFVARFIGKNLILPSEIKAVRGMEVEAVNRHGTIIGECKNAPAARQVSVNVVIPSKAIKVTPSDAVGELGPNKIFGRIESRIDSVLFTTLVVTLDAGGQVTLRQTGENLPQDSGYRVGEDVCLGFSVEDVVFV